MAKSKRISQSPEKANDPLASPMMRQYLELKSAHPGSVLFFRMGDFYEMFLEDAEEAAPIMDVALTKRQNSVPMAGVPYHSVDTYIARLISAGKKVAIAEQEADPENPKLMRRRVRRIISPGTVVEDALLDGAGHNYLLAVAGPPQRRGLALADISTGDFFALEVEGVSTPTGATSATAVTGDDVASSQHAVQKLRDYYFRYGPREIIVPASEIKTYRDALPEAAQILAPVEDWKASAAEGKRRIEKTFGSGLKGLGYDDETSPALAAVSLALHYIDSSFPERRIALNPPALRREEGARMILDEQTIRNLDLVFNYQEGGRSRTLLAILDRSKTAPGKRRLRDSLLSPFCHIDAIQRSLKLTELFVNASDLRYAVRESLEGVRDLERIMGRISSGRGAPRDFISLIDTVAAAQKLIELRNGLPEADSFPAEMKMIPPSVVEFAQYLKVRVSDEPPAILGNAPFLKEGYSAELDTACEARENGSRWLLQFEREERKRTGITVLKVKYNRVAGYFIEIPKGQVARAPEEYVRRQTLTGAERFSCSRLEELSKSIEEADQVIDREERQAFTEFCDRFLELGDAIRELMEGIAAADFYANLAEVATAFRWTRPIPGQSGELLIEGGRHPVVEAFMDPGERFVPNDLRMDAVDRSFAVLTGPNMAGKSTYIRQIAIVQLLMQIGSFVPAARASLPVVDRIFTRIGAADNLTRGESTFYVEMTETARILNQATAKSLVIMDEVGRGTSTYDGLSIAWAVTEYLSAEDSRGPLTLFATHYHELTALESRSGVFNLTMDVRESGGKAFFLHRVREGAADQSYGIHVADLAGLPPEVTNRAREKLQELEEEYRVQQEKPPRRISQRERRSARASGDGAGMQPDLFG